jgi:hypothetical protein
MSVSRTRRGQGLRASRLATRRRADRHRNQLPRVSAAGWVQAAAVAVLACGLGTLAFWTVPPSDFFEDAHSASIESGLDEMLLVVDAPQDVSLGSISATVNERIDGTVSDLTIRLWASDASFDGSLSADLYFSDFVGRDFSSCTVFGANSIQELDVKPGVGFTSSVPASSVVQDASHLLLDGAHVQLPLGHSRGITCSSKTPMWQRATVNGVIIGPPTLDIRMPNGCSSDVAVDLNLMVQSGPGEHQIYSSFEDESNGATSGTVIYPDIEKAYSKSADCSASVGGGYVAFETETASQWTEFRSVLGGVALAWFVSATLVAIKLWRRVFRERRRSTNAARKMA